MIKLYTKERRRTLAKKKEKLLDKFVKKDYNNDLEEVLTKKKFKEEAKNLLLDSLYKTENAYRDYETVKKNVPSIEEYTKNIIQSVKNSCDEIEIIKPKIGEKPYYKIDKENKKITCFPSAKEILYAIAKIQKHEDIIKQEPDFINYALTDVLNIGNCINSIEPIRDFNGFSWSVSISDIEDYYCNLIYQDLNILSKYKLIEEWIDNNDDMIDYMDLFKADLEKKYGKKYQKEIIEILKYLSILIEISKNKTYKSEISKRKKEIQTELEAMKDLNKYLENVYKYKKKIIAKIKKNDLIISDKEKLINEYEKRNKDLPIQKKIFSKKVLKTILLKERDEYLAELELCNDKINPKKFVKVKKQYEYEYEYLKLVEYKNVNEEIERLIVLLQKRVLQAIKLKIKNSDNREEINRIIYELRYFNMLPINSKIRLGDVSKLKKMIDITKTEAISKVYELKSFKDIFKDKSKNINVLKYLFGLKIIRLEDVGIEIIKEKDENECYVQFFDDDVLDEKFKIDIQINKSDLKIRFNKKIKVFDL